METEKKLIYTKVPTNFVYPEIRETDFCFGSNQLVGTPLREDGDWRDFLPPEELQNRHDVESSACFIEAQQHTIATIFEEQFDIKDQNFSSRFNLINSNASPDGGSPTKGADSIRHDGLIPDEMLAFNNDILSWLEFCSFKGGSELECVKAGQEWLKKWDPKYDIVFTKHEPVLNKYKKLKKALQYSPVPASVCAWIQDEYGTYVKPEGESDNHLVEIAYVDEQNCAYIWDTYYPFLKKLAPMYDFDFAMRWSVEKKEFTPNKSNWVIDLIKKLFSFFFL